MTYFIIHHFRRGFFTHFIEEHAQPVYSHDEALAEQFPTFGLAKYEMLRWHRTKKPRIGVLEREGTCHPSTLEPLPKSPLSADWAETLHTEEDPPTQSD